MRSAPSERLAIAGTNARLRVHIRGAVQGVGFRPFVYRLARTLHLPGWVCNTGRGVTLEVEGDEDDFEEFLVRLGSEAPPRSAIHGMEPSYLDPVGFAGFEIRGSLDEGETNTLVLPDIATCADCLSEITDPADRRYRYPFGNCTNCGPRFTIVRSLPYDRRNTSMAIFQMCAHCQEEYDDPLDRRFHAQPIACPQCGPQLQWWNRTGATLSERDDALMDAMAAIHSGAVVAVKGLGGFHLVVNAFDEAAVSTLRQRKRREAKPLALMYPGIDAVIEHCHVSGLERRLLLAPEAPITLLQRRAGGDLADSVAPGNPQLGVMLPYTPLHHLLLAGVGGPVVATSGNLTDEPICIDETEVVERLGDIADFFLIHDRPIVRHVDDSVARVVSGHEQVLRRARGYAPMPVRFADDGTCVLGVGAHQKSAVALASDGSAIVGQHIGDLETVQACNAFEHSIADLGRLHQLQPRTVACDLHPGYYSTRYARSLDLPVLAVQHHHAHVLACMADNELRPPLLGVCWDGTGYGTDDTVWGGEFLSLAGDDVSSFVRTAHLRPFRLPGGDRAVIEPRRAALGALYAIHGDDLIDADIPLMRAFSRAELRVLEGMLRHRVNTPLTSSAGRLFDAIAAILGLWPRVRFEAQAAMALEFAITPGVTDCYEFELSHPPEGPTIVDWGSVLDAVIEECERGTDTGIISARFHNTMVEIIVSTARLAGEDCVLLTGGCFQNRYLSERAVSRLRDEGFRPYWNQRVPPNDGGIAVGQVVAADQQLKEVSRVPGRTR